MKYYNIKAPTKLFEHCSNSTIIANEPLVIPAIQEFLMLVSKENIKHGGFAEIYHEEIKQIFRGFQYGYSTYIQELKNLSIILVDEFYDFVGCTSPNSNQESVCKKYYITHLGNQLINDFNIKHLDALINDKEIQRKKQKAISADEYLKTPLQDVFQNYIRVNLKNITISADSRNEILSRSFSEPEETQANLTYNLNLIESKKYQKSKYNDADGRLTNSYTQMPKKIKQHLRIKNGNRMFARRYSIDIRSSSPTFFSSYICDKALILTAVQKESIIKHTNDLIQSILPSEGGTKSDNDQKRQCFWGISELKKVDENTYYNALHNEHRRWLDLFLHDTIDPRTVIAESLNEEKDYIKSVIIETINGSQKYPEFVKWMRQNFTLIYYTWQILGDVDNTGPNISKIFENAITQDIKLLRYADSLDIVILYENDGFGVYADPEDISVESKTKSIVNMISQNAISRWGFTPFVKMDVSDDSVEQWFDPSDAKKVVARMDEYHKKADKLRKRLHATKVMTEIQRVNLRREYYKAKDRFLDFVNRHSDVLNAYLEELRLESKKQKALERVMKKMFSFKDGEF